VVADDDGHIPKSAMQWWGNGFHATPGLIR
jgi:hypothetical protein